MPVRVIDSHTEGEPTRLVIEGGPDLGSGSISERRERFQKEFDTFRSAVVNEPRGSDAVVGALLCEPVSPSAAAGVIFFNNVDVLGMCGHGTIGLIASLKHLGRIGSGSHIIETPVGDVIAELAEDGSVSIENVHSYRYRTRVTVEVPAYGTVTGDVAYGGNWFFLVKHPDVPIDAGRMDDLTRYAKAIKAALVKEQVTGREGAEIDHVELFGPPQMAGARSKNFVLCPGGAYDRSPCGTGLSAKLACLASDQKLAPGEDWRQESIIGTSFVGSYRLDDDGIIPIISGRAYVTADSTLLFDDQDPLKDGIRI